MPDDNFVPPEKTGSDTAHMVAKAAISGVPLVGSPAAEFFAYLVASPLEKRRQSWAEDVGQALRDLTHQVSGLEERLKKNPAFADLALHATQAAMRSSSEEKRGALCNAVLNAALSTDLDVEREHLFIRLVDELSPQQVQMLDLFNDPAAWFQRNGRQLSSMSMGALAHVVEEAFPQLRGQRSLYDQLWRELHGRGLTSTDSLHVTMTGHGLMQSRTSELGREFLQFISLPTRSGG